MSARCPTTGQCKASPETRQTPGAEAVKTTISLYKEQAMKDYQLLRSTKEPNIVLAHLANRQSLGNLELNSRILHLIQEKEARIETNVGADLKKATASLKISMQAITQDCITRLETQYGQVLQHVTPYDTEDARRLLDKQRKLLDTLEATNAALVSENSSVRVHHSFMPIRYREEIERMQQQGNQMYREQRKIPNQDHITAKFRQPWRHYQARRSTASA
jgi:hypothetical protein